MQGSGGVQAELQKKCRGRTEALNCLHTSMRSVCKAAVVEKIGFLIHIVHSVIHKTAAKRDFGVWIICEQCLKLAHNVKKGNVIHAGAVNSMQLFRAVFPSQSCKTPRGVTARAAYIRLHSSTDMAVETRLAARATGTAKRVFFTPTTPK